MNLPGRAEKLVEPTRFDSIRLESSTEETIRVESSRIESIRPTLLTALFPYLPYFFLSVSQIDLRLVESSTAQTIRLRLSRIDTTLNESTHSGCIGQPSTNHLHKEQTLSILRVPWGDVITIACPRLHKTRSCNKYTTTSTGYRKSRIQPNHSSNSRRTKASIGNCVTPAGNSLTRKSTNFETFFFLSLAVIKISVCYLQILKEESFTFTLICNLFQMEEFAHVNWRFCVADSRLFYKVLLLNFG